MFFISAIGGIKQFSNNSNVGHKWCLNRAEQSKNTKASRGKVGLSGTSQIHSCLRPSKILSSEQSVTEIMHLLMEEYINLFDIMLDAC